MAETEAWTIDREDRGGIRAVVEGLGVCAAAIVAVQGLRLVAREASVETILGVLAPVFVLLELALLAAVLYAVGAEGARRRIGALRLRPGWVDARQGLMTGVVGLATLGLLQWAAEAVLGIRLEGPGGASVDGTGAALAFIRSHPWAAVGLATAAGVVEEILFRGWGVLLVRRADPSLTVLALVASSLLFGAAHVVVPLTGFVYYTLLGLVFAGVALASGSVLPGLVLHGGINALVIAAVVLSA